MSKLPGTILNVMTRMEMNIFQQQGITGLGLGRNTPNLQHVKDVWTNTQEVHIL